jgi:hypothetical protein
MQFRIGTTGTIAYSSSQPSLPPPVVRCVNHAAKAARIRPRPTAAFSARYTYRVPR